MILRAVLIRKAINRLPGQLHIPRADLLNMTERQLLQLINDQPKPEQ